MDKTPPEPPPWVSWTEALKLSLGIARCHGADHGSITGKDVLPGKCRNMLCPMKHFQRNASFRKTQFVNDSMIYCAWNMSLTQWPAVVRNEQAVGVWFRTTFQSRPFRPPSRPTCSTVHNTQSVQGRVSRFPFAALNSTSWILTHTLLKH